MSPCQALPPGPAREDAFNPHPSPKPGSVEERISVKEGGLPLPLANGATADNLVDKCNRSVSHRHLTIFRGGAAKFGFISITYKHILGVYKYILRLEISTFDRENH